uniref:Uncharacterized protein n=1 Tax=Opuntia streptacantha TaxID=393608 RepID=A0A7C9ALF5_OPUST
MLFLKRFCYSRHWLLFFPPNFKFCQSPTRQSYSTLSSLINLCKEPHLLKQVHARCVLHGHHQNSSLSSELLECYASLGLVNLSLQVFNSIPAPSLEIYSTVIQILADSGHFENTLLLYDEMVSNSMYPDEFAFPFVLRSSMQLLDANYGRRVHGHLVKLGFDSNETVAVALAEFYSEVGEFDTAREVLDEMPVRGLDHWNSPIAKCLQNGSAEESFLVFKQMMKENAGPDSVSVINLLRASTELNSVMLGMLVHGLIVVSGLTKDLTVNTALLTVYSKLGCLKNAGLVFEKTSEKDRVVWNLMISTYARYGLPRKSVDLMLQMRNEGIRIDLFTALAVIPAIGELRSLEWGKQIHASIMRNCSDYQVSVQNSLIDMYCKCDSVEAATRVFHLITGKTDISWTSMIKGYVSHGQYNDALGLFVKMKLNGSNVSVYTSR